LLKNTKDISVFKLLLTNCSWSATFGCPHSSDRTTDYLVYDTLED
jgi:hypothetical protein